MDQARFTALFNLRYAVRVLERNARFWGLMAAAAKAVSILSGTVALAALTAGSSRVSIALGVLFAAFQALEHAFDPSGKRAESLAQRREYARLLAAEAAHDTASLEQAYQRIVADDQIEVLSSLKQLAYNDVVREKGADDGACFAEHRVMRALS